MDCALRSRILRSGFVGFALLALALFVCFPLLAQVTGGMISGTVADSSGGAVPKAKIAITDPATGITRQVTSDQSGFYTAPNLQPGPYEVTVSAVGFTTEVRKGLVVAVGSQQTLNLVLKVGAVTQKVVVTAAAPLVQLASSAISNQVSSVTVRQLPLNGRDWTQLATLQPGVASMGSLQPGIGSGSGSARGNRGFGTQLTISGGRPEQNNYLIDGISVNDYDNSSPGDALGVALGVDAIQEFSVITTNYSAEYGRTSGGVITAITKSGTNQFHGDAYEFLRNSALDSRNYFDKSKIPPFRRNQFGASAGGPIRKNSSFIFGDYEGLRQALGITQVDTVPSETARQGTIFNSDGTTTQITVDPTVQKFLPLWHVPNAGLLGLGNTGLYSFVSNQVASEDFFTTRFDQQLSSKDSFSAAYRFDNSLGTLPDVLNVVLTGQKVGSQSFEIQESHIFSPTFMNNMRFGFNRVNAQGGYGISAINALAADPSLGAGAGRDAPQTFVTGLTTLQGGVNDQNNTHFWWNSFQEYDDAFLTIGKNSLKFGVSVERDQDHVLQFSTVGAQYHFGSLEALIENQPTAVAGTIASTVGPRYFRQTLFGAYIQDDLSWRPNVTFNLGMRYEMSTNPTEINGKLVNMPTPTATAPHVGNPLFLTNPTLRDFEPRLGFAWDPFKNGKTSIRGGFGMFDVMPLPYEWALTELQLYPFTITGRATNLPQGSFPNQGLTELAGSPPRVAYVQPNPPRDYVMQWNLNVQRQLAPSLGLMVAYLGSHGVHQLFRGDDMNMVMPIQLPSGEYEWPSPAGSGTPLNPHFGRIDISSWNESSLYDALEAQVTKQMSHGLRAEGSYTWGKCIDDGSGSALGDPFANSISNLFWFDTKFNRSLCDYNVAQTFIANYTWNVPSPQFSFTPARWIAGGWETDGILTARTGLPFSVLIGGDPLGTKDASPFDFPNRSFGPGCASAVKPGNQADYIKLSCFSVPNPITILGNAQRNSLIGPGMVEFDFSLLKNNYIPEISENFNIQFRAEFFNLFNHTNFNPPVDNNTLFNQSGAPVGGAGLIDSTSTTAREIQFALKLIW
jgi:hypothetical protein